MAARAIWKGELVIGKSKLPVSFYSGVQDRKVHFRLLHAKDLAPVEQRIVRKSDGKEVSKEEQLKAYPVDAGHAVIVKPEEIEKAEPSDSREVALLRFVPGTVIGDEWYERPYYLGPDRKEEGAYFALADVLARRKVVGIARWSMRNKRYVGALTALDGYLSMITLRRAEQVLSVSGIEIPAARQPDEKEVRLAEQLVEAIAADFEPQVWHDEYRERLMKMIEAKAKGHKIPVKHVKPAKQGGDLAEQLAASLAAARDGPARRRAAG